MTLAVRRSAGSVMHHAALRHGPKMNFRRGGFSSINMLDRINKHENVQVGGYVG